MGGSQKGPTPVNSRITHPIQMKLGRVENYSTGLKLFKQFFSDASILLVTSSKTKVPHENIMLFLS